MASSWFDQSYYLSAKAAYNNAHAVGGLTTWTPASVQASFASAGLTPEQHYSQYGWSEALAPNAYYVESQYVTSKVNALNAGSVGGRTNWTSSEFYSSLNGANPFNHYLQYGAYESGVEPSTGFNDDTYYANKATYNNAHSIGGITTWTASTVKAAFQSAGLTPIGHYELYGQTEGFYNPIPTPTPGQTYTLTTGIDTVTGIGGPVTILGDNATWQSADVLNGGGGAASVNYTTGGAAAIALTPNMQAVQTMNGTFASTAGVTMNMVNSAGLTTLNSIGSSDAFTMNNVGALLTGGINLQGVTAGATTVAYKSTVVSGTEDAQAVSFDTSVAGAVTVNGIETFNVAATGGKSTIAGLVSDKLATVKINSTATDLLTITAALAGATTVTAAGSTGKVSVQLDAAKDVAVTGGKGDDTFQFAAGYTSADTIDGGEGVNTLRMTNQATIPATKATNITNIQTLAFDALTGAAAVNVTNVGGALTGFVFGDDVLGTDGMAANTATITNGFTASTYKAYLDGATLGTISHSLKSDGTADTLAVQLINTDNSGGATVEGLANLTASTIEDLALNFSVKTGADTGDTIAINTLSAAAATKLTITGNQIARLGNTASTLTELALVDASKYTGALTLGGAAGGAAFSTVNTGAEINTGSGNDQVHLNVQASGVLKAMNLGSGTNTLILDSATGTGSSIVDLTSTTDQISQINGGANAAVQLGIRNIDLSGFSSGTATAQITGTTAANTIVGTSGGDTINGNGGNDTITGGAGADSLTGGSGVDTYVQGAASSVASSGGVLAGATYAALDTIVFGSSLDVISNFTAGASGDALDVTTAGAATTLIGKTAAGNAAYNGVTYFASGAYNAGTKTFTLAADGAGADTLIYIGTNATSFSASGAAGANTSAIVLQGVNSANLVAANFV